jgi:chromosome partitioning protein
VPVTPEAIPTTFRADVLGHATGPAPTVEADPFCLATIRYFATLVPIAQQAGKPMFDLKQSYGIGGGQIQSVHRCRQVFEQLVKRLIEQLDAAQPLP